MSGAFTPLWQRPEFVPCRVGDVLSAEDAQAVLPGVDGVLRNIAAALGEQVVVGGVTDSVTPKLQELQAV